MTLLIQPCKCEGTPLLLYMRVKHINPSLAICISNKINPSVAIDGLYTPPFPTPFLSLFQQ